MMHIHAALIVAMLSFLNSSIEMQTFDREVGSLVQQLEQLYSAGVDVDPLVRDLDRAVKLYENGHRDSAITILKEIRERIELLKSRAPEIALRKRIALGIEVGALASIPLLVYFVLPRIYLLLWYRARRKWLVERARR